MSRKIAYAGMLLAVDTVLFLMVNVFQTNTIFLLGLASLPIAIVIMNWGPKTGIAFYIASLVISFIAMANKIHWIIYVLTFGRQSFIYPYLKAMGVRIIFAVPGIVIATIFVTFPFISRELIPVLTSQGTDEEEAAALMGANGWTIFWKVTFPHIKWPLLYGIVLCTARAMGEFGAVSVLSGHLRGRTNTMPLYIELLYQGYDFTGAFAVSAILVLMAVIILVLRSVLEYKGQQAAKAEKEQQEG